MWRVVTQALWAVQAGLPSQPVSFCWIKRTNWKSRVVIFRESRCDSGVTTAERAAISLFLDLLRYR